MPRPTSAIRLSFSPIADVAFIDEACSRIQACGSSLKAACQLQHDEPPLAPPAELTRFVVDGACCYLLADAASRRCIVIDPLPELTSRLIRWLACRRYELVAVLDTHSHGDHVSSAQGLREGAGSAWIDRRPVEVLGWPSGEEVLALGTLQVTQVRTPGHTADSTAYLVRKNGFLSHAFVGDTVLPGALGRSDFEQSAPLLYSASLQALAGDVGLDTLLLPGHDYDNRFVMTFRGEAKVQPLLRQALLGQLDAAEFAIAKANLEEHLGPTQYQTLACGARVDSLCKFKVELNTQALGEMTRSYSCVLLIDVREPYEKAFGAVPTPGPGVQYLEAPLSELTDSLPPLLALDPAIPIVFYCRSGSRSAQAAQALRRLGRDQSWSLSGGLALWDIATTETVLDLTC